MQPICIILLFIFETAQLSEVLHQSNFSSIYYDGSGTEVPLLREEMLSVENDTEVQSYGYLPCSCADLTCRCCFNIKVFSFKRHSCTNFTYNPYEFSITMNLLMNDTSIYQGSLSGKNPPPACIESPIPYLPSMQFCAKFYDMYTVGRNFHACLSFITKIVRAPVLVLHFDCMQFGSNGVFFSKPFVNITHFQYNDTEISTDSLFEITTEYLSTDLPPTASNTSE